MTDPAPLTARQTNKLITALQQGHDVDAAAATLGVDLSAVWARARTDTRLTIALAGRDPDTAEERGRVIRAEYLRLLALGITPSRAELILGVPGTGAWRRDRGFAKACDAVNALAAPYVDIGRARLTPQRVKKFLEELSRPGTSVLAAAAAVGITPPAIYQKRRRDRAFARAMDEARATASGGVTGAG